MQMQMTHNNSEPQHRIAVNGGGGGDSNGSSPRIHALQAELALLQQKYAFEAAQAHMLSSPDFASKQQEMMQQEQHLRQQLEEQLAYHSAGSDPDEAEDVFGGADSHFASTSTGSSTPHTPFSVPHSPDPMQRYKTIHTMQQQQQQLTMLHQQPSPLQQQQSLRGRQQVRPASPASASQVSIESPHAPVRGRGSKTAVDGAGGKNKSSCHQCKSSKTDAQLFFCTNRAKEGERKRRCRKKYCKPCLKRCYPQGFPEANEGIGEDVSIPRGHAWECPSCAHVCVCASCTRKGKTRPAAEREANDNSAMQRSINTVPSPQARREPAPMYSPSSIMSRNLQHLSNSAGQGLNFTQMSSQMQQQTRQATVHNMEDNNMLRPIQQPNPHSANNSNASIASAEGSPMLHRSPDGDGSGSGNSGGDAVSPSGGEFSGHSHRAQAGDEQHQHQGAQLSTEDRQGYVARLQRLVQVQQQMANQSQANSMRDQMGADIFEQQQMQREQNQQPRSNSPSPQQQQQSQPAQDGSRKYSKLNEAHRYSPALGRSASSAEGPESSPPFSPGSHHSSHSMERPPALRGLSGQLQHSSVAHSSPQMSRRPLSARGSESPPRRFMVPPPHSNNNGAVAAVTIAGSRDDGAVAAAVVLSSTSPAHSSRISPQLRSITPSDNLSLPNSASGKKRKLPAAGAQSATSSASPLLQSHSMYNRQGAGGSHTDLGEMVGSGAHEAAAASSSSHEFDAPHEHSRHLSQTSSASGDDNSPTSGSANYSVASATQDGRPRGISNGGTDYAQLLESELKIQRMERDLLLLQAQQRALLATSMQARHNQYQQYQQNGPPRPPSRDYQQADAVRGNQMDQLFSPTRGGLQSQQRQPPMQQQMQHQIVSPASSYDSHPRDPLAALSPDDPYSSYEPSASPESQTVRSSPDVNLHNLSISVGGGLSLSQLQAAPQSEASFMLSPPPPLFETPQPIAVPSGAGMSSMLQLQGLGTPLFPFVPMSPYSAFNTREQSASQQQQQSQPPVSGLFSPQPLHGGAGAGASSMLLTPIAGSSSPLPGMDLSAEPNARSRRPSLCLPVHEMGVLMSWGDAISQQQQQQQQQQQAQQLNGAS